MQILAWADHRTLLVCHCLLAAVFAAMLLGLRRVYPDLRGVGSMAAGFLAGIPATALLSVRGAASSILTVVAANTLAFLCYILLYRGILRFCQAQFPAPREDRPGADRHWWNQRNGFLPILWASSIGSTFVIVYFSQVHDSVVPRIVAIAATVTIARVVMALTLFRYSTGRTHMVLFGCSLICFAMLSLGFGILAILHGVSTELVQHDRIQSFTLLAGLVFICVDGIFYVAMLGSAITRTIEARAQLDFLTGTINRGGIEKALAMEIARTRRSHRPFAILLIDLDRFKEINDLHGHAAGDEALRATARSIASVLRIYDKLSRFGGDEFLVLLPETSGEAAMLTALRIRESLRTQTLHIAGQPASAPTLSIGVTYCIAEEEAIDILARADAALYQAKRSGRDCARMELPNHPPSGVRLSFPNRSA